MLDAIAPPDHRLYTKGAYLSEFTDDVIDIVTRHGAAHLPSKGPVASAVQNIWFMGGAITEDFAAFSRDGANWLRRTGTRRTRYRGLAKTALAQVLTAAALNLYRLDAWWSGTPCARHESSATNNLSSASRPDRRNPHHIGQQSPTGAAEPPGVGWIESQNQAIPPQTRIGPSGAAMPGCTWACPREDCGQSAVGAAFRASEVSSPRGPMASATLRQVLSWKIPSS